MIKTMLIAALFALGSVTAIAQTSQEKGLAIAVEADKRGEGFGDSQVELKMVLVDSKGTEAPRDMRVKSLEGVGEEGDKSLMIFDTPIDQKGVAMLTYTHKDKSDDQWLY